MKHCSVHEITHGRELTAVAAEWFDLWRRCPAASPFQTPQWLLPWWNHFGGNGLCTVAFRRLGRLVGLAPMFECRGALSLLGTGVTDYPDILAEPGMSIDRLGEHLRQFDVDFTDLRPGAQILEVVFAETEPSSVSPVLTVPVTNRASLRRQVARLRREGEVRFETANAETIEEYLDALVKLHQARWTLREERGVFAAGPMAAFLREAAQELLSAGILRFHGLRFDGQLVAALFSMLSRGTSYFYLGGFDPVLASFSPGTMLMGFAIRDAAAAGATEFDFLRGGEPYKYAWGARDRVNMRLRWSSTELRAA